MDTTADMATNHDAASPGGWTVETALQHVLSLVGSNDHRYEQRFIDQERAVGMALASAKEAVIKAEQAAEKRFDAVNEFRATLADQQRNLMPRAEVDVIVRGLHEKISALEKQVDTAQAERQGLKGGWGYAVGVVGLVLALASIIALVVKATP